MIPNMPNVPHRQPGLDPDVFRQFIQRARSMMQPQSPGVGGALVPQGPMRSPRGGGRGISNPANLMSNYGRMLNTQLGMVTGGGGPATSHPGAMPRQPMLPPWVTQYKQQVGGAASIPNIAPQGVNYY